MKLLATLAIGLSLTAAAQAQQLAAPTDSSAAQPAAAPVASASPSPVSSVEAAAPAAPATPAMLECTTLAGRVADAFDYPLTGATVMLRTRDKAFSIDAFSTNADGRYLITSKKPIPRDAILQISAAGYTSVEQPLSSCKALDISLELLPGTNVQIGRPHQKDSHGGQDSLGACTVANNLGCGPLYGGWPPDPPRLMSDILREKPGTGPCILT